MNKKVKILLVDNHSAFLKGLMEVIQEEFISFNLFCFSSSEEALYSAKENKYDLAIFDLEMAVINGISFHKELKLLNPETLSILLTLHKEQDIIQSVFEKGIEGFVLKDNILDELVIAIKEVLKGNKYFSKLDALN